MPTALARELGIPRVLVPPRPGVTNALGCLVADARHDFVRTLNKSLQALDMAELRKVGARAAADGRAALARETTPIEGETLLIAADMQFRGQTHLIRVDLPAEAVLAGTLPLDGPAAPLRRGLFQPLCRAPPGNRRHAGQSRDDPHRPPSGPGPRSPHRRRQPSPDPHRGKDRRARRLVRRRLFAPPPSTTAPACRSPSPSRARPSCSSSTPPRHRARR